MGRVITERVEITDKMLKSSKRLIDADALMVTLKIPNTDCEECKSADPNYGICMRDFVEACTAIKNAPTVEERKWIPCSERLPKESGLYLVTGGLSGTEVCSRYYNVRDDGGFWSGHPYDAVIAWMPLPEPYKERREE